MEKSDSDEDIMNILEPMNFDESIDDPSFMNSTINLKKNKEIDFYGESISNYINIVESIDKNNYIKFDNFLNENYLPDLTKKIMQFFVKNDHYFSNVDYDIDSNYYEKIKDLFQLIIDKKLEINCKIIHKNCRFYKKYYFI